MQNYFWTAVLASLFALGAIADPADAQLLQQALPALPEDQEVVVLEVDLAPGQAAPAHRHNAHVFVYVLEGSVTMRVAGGAAVTLSPGETYYENPDDVHLVTRNASETVSAKFLVHMIKTIGAPVSVPGPG